MADLARAQAEAGHRVTVVSLIAAHSQRVLPLGRHDNLRVVESEYRGSLKLPNRQARQLVLHEAAGSDIIHIHGIWRYHSQAAARVAQALNIPYVVSPHGSLDRYCRTQKRWVKGPYFRLFERPVLNRAAGIHCCSEKERQEIADLDLKPPLFVVPNAVEATLLDQAADSAGLASILPAMLGDRRTILFLGRFENKKRIDLLVHAFAKLAAEFSDWQLVLAGMHEDARVAQKVAALIQQYGLADRVFLPGNVRGGARISLFRAADIMAYASESENFCIALAEAFVFGIPVVATRGVALASDASAAGAGVVCDCTSGALAESLRSLMSNSDLRARQGGAAQELSRRFRGERVAAAMIDEYQRCIDRHANTARHSNH